MSNLMLGVIVFVAPCALQGLCALEKEVLAEAELYFAEEAQVQIDADARLAASKKIAQEAAYRTDEPSMSSVIIADSRPATGSGSNPVLPRDTLASTAASELGGPASSLRPSVSLLALPGDVPHSIPTEMVSSLLGTLDAGKVMTPTVVAVIPMTRAESLTSLLRPAKVDPEFLQTTDTDGMQRVISISDFDTVRTSANPFEDVALGTIDNTVELFSIFTTKSATPMGSVDPEHVSATNPNLSPSPPHGTLEPLSSLEPALGTMHTAHTIQSGHPFASTKASLPSSSSSHIPPPLSAGPSAADFFVGGPTSTDTSISSASGFQPGAPSLPNGETPQPRVVAPAVVTISARPSVIQPQAAAAVSFRSPGVFTRDSTTTITPPTRVSADANTLGTLTDGYGAPSLPESVPTPSSSLGATASIPPPYAFSEAGSQVRSGAGDSPVFVPPLRTVPLVAGRPPASSADSPSSGPTYSTLPQPRGTMAHLPSQGNGGSHAPTPQYPIHDRSQQGTVPMVQQRYPSDDGTASSSVAFPPPYQAPPGYAYPIPSLTSSDALLAPRHVSMTDLPPAVNARSSSVPLPVSQPALTPMRGPPMAPSTPTVTPVPQPTTRSTTRATIPSREYTPSAQSQGRSVPVSDTVSLPSQRGAVHPSSSSTSTARTSGTSSGATPAMPVRSSPASSPFTQAMVGMGFAPDAVLVAIKRHGEKQDEVRSLCACVRVCIYVCVWTASLVP